MARMGTKGSPSSASSHPQKVARTTPFARLRPQALARRGGTGAFPVCTDRSHCSTSPRSPFGLVSRNPIRAYDAQARITVPPRFPCSASWHENGLTVASSVSFSEARGKTYARKKGGKVHLCPGLRQVNSPDSPVSRAQGTFCTRGMAYGMNLHCLTHLQPLRLPFIF